MRAPAFSGRNTDRSCEGWDEAARRGQRVRRWRDGAAYAAHVHAGANGPRRGLGAWASKGRGGAGRGGQSATSRKKWITAKTTSWGTSCAQLRMPWPHSVVPAPEYGVGASGSDGCGGCVVMGGGGGGKGVQGAAGARRGGGGRVWQGAVRGRRETGGAGGAGRARIGEWAGTEGHACCMCQAAGGGGRCVGVGAEWGEGRHAGVLVRGAADRARASPTAAAASIAPTRQRTTPTPRHGCAALRRAAPSAVGPPGTSAPPRRAGGVLARQGQRHPSASATWRRG